ncbi:MAG: hypothetical protein U0168_23755 [Nannocystaceae bacterium]
MSEQEIDALVIESLDHAEEDFAARALAEARVELDRVALAVRTALTEVEAAPSLVAALLPAAERASIVAALAEADAAMAASEAKPVQRAREALEQVSEPFARRRMERALQAGMAGRTVAEIEAEVQDEAELAPRRAGHGAEVI